VTKVTGRAGKKFRNQLVISRRVKKKDRDERIRNSDIDIDQLSDALQSQTGSVQL